MTSQWRRVVSTRGRWASERRWPSSRASIPLCPRPLLGQTTSLPSARGAPRRQRRAWPRRRCLRHHPHHRPRLRRRPRLLRRPRPRRRRRRQPRQCRQRRQRRQPSQWRAPSEQKRVCSSRCSRSQRSEARCRLASGVSSQGGMKCTRSSVQPRPRPRRANLSSRCGATCAPLKSPARCRCSSRPPTCISSSAKWTPQRASSKCCRSRRAASLRSRKRSSPRRSDRSSPPEAPRARELLLRCRRAGCPTGSRSSTKRSLTRSASKEHLDLCKETRSASKEHLDLCAGKDVADGPPGQPRWWLGADAWEA
mmetsp:Transcript_28843/g.74093  ORF Transcript_28843/g.74093 Transcript_28843/m.74093 type:complete len:309 (+) Transcript_28843:753-1679(+)